jgi:membrane-associated phospholipid phosphatase
MESWLQSLMPWGTQVIIWVQSHTPAWVTTVAKGFTSLGYTEFYLVFLPLIYWCIHREIGAAAIYLSLFSAWVNDAIKYIFRLPRPSSPRIHVPEGYVETSPSFPSGHAQNAVANWGFVAVRLRHWAFWIVAIVAIVGIGLSRIVLGVHFPEDVIGGWIIGLILLLIYIWAEPSASRWIGQQGIGVQAALAVIVPTGLIFLHPADNQGFYPAPNSIVPLSTLVGAGVGLIMERAWVRFGVQGPWWQRGARYVVGLVVLGIAYVGSGAAVPTGLAYGLESLSNALRYLVVGWTAAFLCPWLFVRLHLASHEAAPQRPREDVVR